MNGVPPEYTEVWPPEPFCPPLLPPLPPRPLMLPYVATPRYTLDAEEKLPKLTLCLFAFICTHPLIRLPP